MPACINYFLQVVLELLPHQKIIAVLNGIVLKNKFYGLLHSNMFSV